MVVTGVIMIINITIIKGIGCDDMYARVWRRERKMKEELELY